MIKVYQKIVDPKNGDCMQAAVASLFEMKLKDVPEFIKMPKGTWFQSMIEFFKTQGYEYKGELHNKNYNRLNTPTYECFKKEKWHRPSIMTKKALHKLDGIDGYFFACVLSPKFFTWANGGKGWHAVIIDRDYNIIHDPNRGYKDILKYPLTSILGYNGVFNVWKIEKGNI